MEKELRILYEDAAILVCHKPAGMAVQTARLGEMDLENQIKTHRAKKGEKPEIYVIHRLDQPVEGLLVFAKTREAAAELNRQLQQDSFTKLYHALVEGKFGRKETTDVSEEIKLENFLLRDGKTNTSRVVEKETPGAKKAVLYARLLAYEEGRSLLGIRLLTGRHHQIRVQLAATGHPLVGDRKYNSYATVGERMQLQAVELHFHHPLTKEELAFCLEEKEQK